MPLLGGRALSSCLNASSCASHSHVLSAVHNSSMLRFPIWLNAHRGVPLDFCHPPNLADYSCQLSSQEATDISILFMQADLEIHCFDVRLRVHLSLAEMDENLPSVDCCKEGLGVQGTHIRYLSSLTTQNSSALLRFLQESLLPCEAESQIRKLRALCKLSLLCTLRLGSPECKRQNCSPSSLVNCICIQAKSQINYDCPTLTV
ncbi:hypothetical protein T10_12517 [Trichinella papuae]|uniref:Uncharacterized protein n=1 Tax=Trichinella papuae TaxID=268474 RepID=A0A0V1N122_9BILA|nr:hypothetical protein T10_12517 [Trichinella papuae]